MKNLKNYRICVLSGRYPASKFESYLNHCVYCDYHQYTYIYCNWPTKTKNKYMNKIEYIKKYYRLFDYIFWIDDDAFFMNIEKSLDEFLPEKDIFLSICSSPDYKKIHTFISSGQFMLKCSERGRKFIDAIQEVDLLKVKKWWDDSLGYFTNGDQDAIVYLLKENSEFKDHFEKFHHKKFNSRAEEILKEGGVSNVFILHFTGTPVRKEEDYLKIQKFLKSSPSLVNASLTQNYNLVKKKSNIYVRLYRYLKNKYLTIRDSP